mgnify:CR=1 FL=1
MKHRVGTYCARTDIGRVRLTNEDQALVLANAYGDVMMLVADGMGGHAQGDFASRIAIDVLGDAFRNKNRFWSTGSVKKWLKKTIRHANKQIYQEAQENDEYKDMGTTLVVALIHKNKVIIANVGDSRAYFLLEQKMYRLTEDQTFVDYLFRTGQIKEEEIKSHPRRHVLLNALGITPSVNIDLNVFSYEDQPVMLCSDGLYNNLSNKEIEVVLLTDDSVDQKCDMLIAIANKNGGSDNIAVALWEATT